MQIGKKIKMLRHECGLTQEELADRCELTKGYISQLENELTSPAISTLLDILEALGTTAGEFFAQDKEEKIVFKKNDYFEKETEESKITWLVPNSQKNEMEPMMMELNPGQSTTMDFPHEGEEFGFVLAGEIALHYGSKTVKVGKGETFYYVSNKPHYIENKGSSVAKIIWIASPPTF